MNRPYYTDYVRHALRFYTRNPIMSLSDFKTKVDKENWLACHTSLRKYSKLEQDLFTTIYSGHDTLADEVFQASAEFKIHQNKIWDMMKEFERQIAKKRGLL